MQRKKLPVPVVLISMYALITVLVLLAVFPIYSAVYNLTKENYIRTSLNDLEDDVSKIDSMVFDIMQLRNIYEQNPIYTDLKYDHAAEHDNQYYYKLMKSKSIITSGLRMIEGSTECFVYFPDNGTVITKYYAYDSIEGGFADYMSYQGRSAAEIANEIETIGPERGFIAENAVSFFGSTEKNCLTLVHKMINDSVVYGILLSEKDISRIFGFDTLPPDTFLYLFADDATPLFRMNYPDETALAFAGQSSNIDYHGKKYTVISKKLAAMNLQVHIGIPDSFFKAKLMPLVSLYIRYSMLALFLGLILGAAFAIYNYMPLKRLQDMAMKTKYARKGKPLNLYHYLGEVISKSDHAIQNLETTVHSMRNKYQCNLFLRLQHGTWLEDEDPKLVEDILPQVNGSFYVAIIDYAVGQERELTDSEEKWLLAALFNDLGNDYIIAQTGCRRASALIQNEENSYQHFVETIEKINAESVRRFNLQLNIRVSDVNSGINGVFLAANHASQAMYGSEKSIITAYKPSQNLNTEAVLSRKTIQKLYKYIISGDMDSVRAEMHDIELALSDANSQEKVYQTYCSIRFVLEDIMSDLNIMHTVPEYNPMTPVREMFEPLLQFAQTLADDIVMTNTSINQQKRNEIVHYVDQHYADPEIYAESIARNLNCSGKYVYIAVREKTGKSLNTYIETRRMELAMKLLKDTDKKVNEISEACGYHNINNFYKVFKKFYSQPPGFYRRHAT